MLFFVLSSKCGFAERHDKLETCVGKVLYSLLEARGELSRQGIMVVADRGYAKPHVLHALMDQGLSCFCVMPEFMWKCHPIVGKSYLKVAPYIEGDSDDEKPPNDNVEGGEKTVVYDKPSRFVMEDGPLLGPGVNIAKTHYKPQDKTREVLTAIAVREHGTAKRSKIVCVMYSMGPSWEESLFTWFAIPCERNFRDYLFTTRDDNGRIIEPDGQTYRSVVEQHLLQCCEVLSVGQRCADWIVMRQFNHTLHSTTSP